MFREVLRDVVERTEGGLAGLLMGFDGIPVDAYIKETDGAAVDVETVGMEYSVILKDIRRAAEMLEAGGAREVSIQAERLTTVIRLLNEEYFVAITMLPDGNYGKARFLLRTAGSKLISELTEPPPPVRILVLHGPNLNLLGAREPEIYGRKTLETIEAELQSIGFEIGALIESRQSNSEGELIDWVQSAREDFDGLLLNAAGYSHTSIALRDAIRACGKPCVEVHLSNVHAREPFRHTSMLAGVCVGVVMGFGPHSYSLGLRGLIDYLRAPEDAGPAP